MARVSAAGAVALGGDRVDERRIVHLACSDSEEVRRLQADVPAFGAGAARCGPSRSVLGGVPRAELLCYVLGPGRSAQGGTTVLLCTTCRASVPRRVLRT